MRYVDAVAAGINGISDLSSDDVFQSLLNHELANDPFFCVYVGFPDGSGIFSDEWVPDPNEWLANERDWYIGAAASPNRVFVTDIYPDADTGELCITLSKAFYRDGSLAGVAAVDIFITVLEEMIGTFQVWEKGDAFLTKGDGRIIAHPNSAHSPYVDARGDTVFFNMIDIDNGIYRELALNTTFGETVSILSADGIRRYYTASEISSTGWIVYATVPSSIIYAPIYTQIATVTAVSAVILVVAVVLISLTIKSISKPIYEKSKRYRRSSHHTRRRENFESLHDLQG
jgi:methyl-accepting chemotaxis protein